MSHVVQIPDELAAKAIVRAREEGKGIDLLVQEAVEEKLARPANGAAALQKEYGRWHEEFMEWVAGHEANVHVADDSRESIYSGRGE